MAHNVVGCYENIFIVRYALYNKKSLTLKGNAGPLTIYMLICAQQILKMYLTFLCTFCAQHK